MSKILLVDDVPTNLDILLQLLEPLGCQLLVANNGEKALKVARQTLPDLVLLDIMMPPGIDGYEVCARLRADQATADIPVIFLSALDDIDRKIKGFDVGGVDYVSKPFQSGEVLARVTTHLRLRRVQKELQEANEKLARLAAEDGLTGLANRRRLDEHVHAHWYQSAREQLSFALILCDVDCFKLYNDHYGHQSGDECLRAVAQAIKGALKRPIDLVGRYGGEEFLIVLPNTDLAGAQVVAGEIAAAVRGLALAHEKSTAGRVVSLSVGVAASRPEPDQTPSDLIRKADEALYEAKRQGRNRVVALSGSVV